MDLITLENKNNQKLIKDTLLYPLKINIDETGGSLVEILRNDWKNIYGPGREFFMQYYSVTDPGLTRDEKVWHYHLNQEDRFLVVGGGSGNSCCRLSSGIRNERIIKFIPHGS